MKRKSQIAPNAKPSATEQPQWLTIEEAAQTLALEVEVLQSYLQSEQPEKQFQAQGLLFDRSRWQNDEPAFLQLLSAHQPLPATTGDRSYDWNTLALQIQIRYQPSPARNSQRQVLLTVTTYDDFPLSTLIPESELGELPAIVCQLLDRLKGELPIRQMHYQQNNKKKTKPTPSQAATTQSTRPLVENPKPKKTELQTRLF